MNKKLVFGTSILVQLSISLQFLQLPLHFLKFSIEKWITLGDYYSSEEKTISSDQDVPLLTTYNDIFSSEDVN